MHADGHADIGEPLGGGLHRLFDGVLVAANDVKEAVNHDLRRVHAAVAARLGIFALAVAIGGARQRVAPAKIVPIIDRVGERDDARLLGKLSQQRIGGWTGRATLTREQLEH